MRCGVVSFFGGCVVEASLGLNKGFLQMGGILVGFFAAQHEPRCYFGLKMILK